MLDWLAELFQPILTAIISLLVWLGIVSPHKEVAVSAASISGASISGASISGAPVVSENAVSENELQVEKPSEEVPAPSNE